MRPACLGLILALSPIAALPQQHTKAAGETDVSREVDRLFAETWAKEKLTPSELSSDAEFLRRVSLDLIGRVPTLEETTEFLRGTGSDKRKKKIDELLASPAFASFWADVWQIRLTGREYRRQFMLVIKKPLNAWLEKAFAENKPWDQFASELIAAEGTIKPPDEGGQTGYVLRWAEGGEAPQNLAGQTVKVFNGIRLQCAQCHDHPYEKWTIQDFWGVAAYFGRAKPKPIRKPDAKNNQFEAIELNEVKRGEVKLPDTQKIVAPKYITGKSGSSDSRRAALAELVTAKDNPYFAKAFANWAWTHFFGRGFVNPVDDFTESNPPVAPEVLELLARDFVENGYDVKRMIRIIANSRTYQLSSKSTKSNEKDKTFFSKALVRPMSPEQLFQSLSEVTGLEDTMGRLKKNRGEGYERLMEQALRQFNFLFDNDEQTEALDFEATITQALFLMNGRLTQEVVPAKVGGALTKILAQHRSPADRIDAIFLTVLSRPPTDAERRKYAEHAGRMGDEGYYDVFWVLLNTTEFFFNH